MCDRSSAKRLLDIGISNPEAVDINTMTSTAQDHFYPYNREGFFTVKTACVQLPELKKNTQPD
jgi:hypothetical protein